MFHHQIKYLEVRQKYPAAHRIFNSLLSVSSGDKTQCLMLDILPEKPRKGGGGLIIDNNIIITTIIIVIFIIIFKKIKFALKSMV